MCSFYSQLIKRLNTDETIDLNFGYLKLDRHGNIRLHTLVNYYGLIIQKTIICAVRQRQNQSGFQSVDSRWFEQTFNTPFTKVPYTLKALRYIGDIKA
jgi:hypothetical protein